MENNWGYHMKHTRFEKARIIGARALQIAMGAPYKLDLTKEDLERMRYSSLEIAKREYELGVVPIDVVRPVLSTVDTGAKGKVEEINA
jgi:DNA-directed RNA polymerase subunit K